MSAPGRHPTSHIVIISHDDHETSAIAGAISRRLQRPLLDRTPHHEPTDADGDAQDVDALAWYARTIETQGESVIAAPTSLLHETDPPTRPDAVWMILLDDSTAAGEGTASDEHSRQRSDTARRLCNVRIDTSGHDTDRIVDAIAHAWEQHQTATETEHHHVR